MILKAALRLMRSYYNHLFEMEGWDADLTVFEVLDIVAAKFNSFVELRDLNRMPLDLSKYIGALILPREIALNYFAEDAEWEGKY